MTTILKTVNDAMFNTFKNTASEDIGCIVYIFDRSPDGNETGFNDANCDIDDAADAVNMIAHSFGMDMERLVALAQEVKDDDE